MEKYKPIKELPDDIKQLPREETVCQFCGVSYLIHHEISKLEDKVKQLEEEINRLKSIEGEKVSWEAERSKLIEEKTLAFESRGKLEDKLETVQGEVSNYQNDCKKLKEVQLLQESENKSLRMQQTQVLSGLSTLKAGMATLCHYKAKISQLLTATSDYLTQSRQQCSLQITAHVNHAGKVMRRLALENESLQGVVNRKGEELTALETNLKQLLEEKQNFLEERRRSSQQYQRKIQDLNEKTQELEQRLLNKDKEITDLHKSQEISKNNAQRLISMAAGNTEEAERKVKELEKEVACVKSHRDSSEEALEKTKLELKRMEQGQKELQSLLMGCQERLSHSEASVKTLQSEHLMELETMKKEQNYQLDSLCKKTKEEREEALQETKRVHLLTERALQAKLTELKSALTACELEKARLISSLQERLQKEKDIADRELTDHLNTVKTLELSLLQEKRARKELEERTSKNSLETEQVLHGHLKSAEKKRLDVENKLSEAYQEICTLQAIVERECEERERLTKELSQAKLLGRKSQNRKPH